MANNLTLRLGGGSGEGISNNTLRLGNASGEGINNTSILRRSTSMSGGTQNMQSGFFNRDANARRSLTMANQVNNKTITLLCISSICYVIKQCFHSSMK